MRRLLAAPLALGLFALVAVAALQPRPLPGGLTTGALTALERSGVRNPVTAVLLNYRGYDTMLEVGVLLLALAAVWSLDRAWEGDSGPAGRPFLLPLLRLALPLTVLVGGYLLWIGSFAPGGAFQGGALVAGGLVLGRLGGVWWPRRTTFVLRAGFAVGLVVFSAAAVFCLMRTGVLLEYPTGLAGGIILLIETAAWVSIGLTLGAMYLGGRPEGSETDEKAVSEPLEGWR